MKISYQWLKRYLPSLDASPEALSEVLPSLGLEVEALIPKGLQASDRVVVGKILSKEKHPNADRLSVCELSIGTEAKPLQIVCGAQNHKTGDKVPVALEGAVLSNNFTIHASTVRGVPSEGMLCSAQELGLAEASEGLLILDPAAPLGEKLTTLFPEKDTILELGITPNRGDALSHWGVARCLSAYYELPLNPPPSLNLPETEPNEGLLKSLKVESSACPYYCALCIEGIRITESPAWLKRDLEALEIKPINTIVDITNWVMLELGQPLHAFDAAKIKGHHLKVRPAKKGESLKALNDKTYELSEDFLVIADSEKPVALAGVIGGSESAISPSTTSIILESAYFEPSAVRKASQRLGIHTDSAYRFVRNVDPSGVALALGRAGELILQLAGGKLAGKHLHEGVHPGSFSLAPKTIALSYAYILDVCGFRIEKETIAKAWQRLGCTVKLPTDDCFEVSVPTFLRDVERPIDLIEELIRIHGSQHIPEESPKLSSLKLEDDSSLKIFQKLEDYLLSHGFSEAYNYTILGQEQLLEGPAAEALPLLALANPLSQEQTHLRNSLIPGLLKTAQYNLHQKNDRHRFFERGKTFIVHQGQVEERFSIACVLLPKPYKTWQNPAKEDFYTVKALLESLVSLAGLKGYNYSELSPKGYQEGYAAYVCSVEDGDPIDSSNAAPFFFASFGTVNLDLSAAYDLPQTLALEMSFSENCFKTHTACKEFKPFATFPGISKDLGLVVDSALPAEKALKDLRMLLDSLCTSDFGAKRIRLFDVFQGSGLPEGKKSLGFEMEFASDTRTLKEAEVNAVFNDLQMKLEALETYKIRKTA